MDDLVEQHAALMRATGQPQPAVPTPALVVPGNLPPEAVADLAKQWGAALENPDVSVLMPVDVQIAHSEPDLASVARGLVRELDKIEDDDGRAIWLTAGEVELDWWLYRVSAARDALSDCLAPREES